MQQAPAKDRIQLVDALRGFALLGIFLANILIFSGWEFLTDAGRAALADASAIDWQHRFHKFFVDGKFYTLFSMLFGAGFALQLERLTQRGADGLRIYRRRVLILLGIGLVHQWLIWDGDILVLYALMGLILPAFHRLSDRALLAWSALLIFAVPIAGVLTVNAAGWPPDAGLLALSERVAVALGAVNPQDGVTWLRRTDFDGWFSWVMSGPIYSWGIRLMSWRIFKVLGIMLLGMWIGRRVASGSLLNDRRLLWRVLAGGLLIGVPANVAYTYGKQWQTDWPSLIGTVPLALAYAAAFALAWPRAQRVLGIFSFPGRMALTNYLTQSIICILVFYGFGLGQVGYWPPAAFYTFALAVFLVQLLLSRWWLRHHAQGPMEALWRRGTYSGRVTRAAAPG
ncbi:DUF418 domain-containing protein [Sphingomonas lutea]|uniref:DUF418 domain-containing protein n=1 Tax=Sphingomonas lutea TaxID=1045317 RepID=A0A7G9SFC4_9SPHN|nr:DUF418 domain-containing protein [Sphingomonas lutea]QNN66549.1 DUF418 domain-containing protein [Sphingomonas lutea]